MTDPPNPQDPPNQPQVSAVDGLVAAMDSLMVLILFLVFYNWFNLGLAIVAATIWSLKVALMRKRKGLPIGKFLPIIVAYIIARGVVGIVTDSEAVYFGTGIATKFAIAAGVTAQALRGRNLLFTLAPYIFEFNEATRNHPIYKAALNRIAYAFSIYYAASAAFDIWLYNNNDVQGYLLVRLFVNWPAGVAVFWLSVWYLMIKLRKVPEFPGLMALFTARTDALEAAWDEKVARRKAKNEAKRVARSQSKRRAKN